MPAPTSASDPDHPRPDHPHPDDPDADLDPTPSRDAILAAEAAHLRASRAGLRRMRERTLALDALGGNAVSTEYLAASLRRRAAALVDSPDTPLFFGRSDGIEGRFYIGRRHVHDEAGEPMVVDWRADVARPFYRATRRDPLGLALRRRFGFERGLLTAYEDEHLIDPDEGDVASRILATEIERPRRGPMRDIVATVQPEQDAVVRADVTRTVCVQGAPGTGKTAVGLHRAAYLLYTFRDRLARAGVLVIGPNPAFLSYISQVLPALGEFEVRQTTVDELLARVPSRRSDTTAAASLKGDPRMAEVLRRAVWSSLTEPRDALVVPRGSRRWRVPAYQARELVDALRSRGVRYGAGRAMLAQRLAHVVLLAMERAGDSPDDRVQDAVARSRPVCAYVDAVWPAVDPARLVARLLSDRHVLAACSEGLLHEAEQAVLLWDRAPRGSGKCAMVCCGRRPRRRARRPCRAGAQPRARGPRRGAGPVPHAAAGDRAPVLDRLGDGAR